jgi:N-acetyl-gamma-glutamyl-phosphate reductase
MSKKFNAAIIGASGYTGSELIRLLAGHPKVELSMVTSESKKGKKLSEIYPWHSLQNDLTISSIADVPDHNPDVVFLALPHGASMNFVKENLEKCRRIIDLSGDFRLECRDQYETWYGMKHVCPEHMQKAVYGMPEFFKNEIGKAQLIANPGCFPTSAIIPLAPLLANDIIDAKGIIIDAKSGVTGAGAKAKPGTHFPDIFGNFKAYKLKSHRHTPEMETILELITGRKPSILFTPHLLPVDRGILSTIYAAATAKTSGKKLLELYKESFAGHPFVRILSAPPSLKAVRGSNFIDIYADYDRRTNRIIAISTIDNLVKGASGAAIANMNIMLEIKETSGLGALPLMP